METVVAPTAADAAATMLTGAREDCQRVRKYLARLKEVLYYTVLVPLHGWLLANAGGVQSV